MIRRDHDQRPLGSGIAVPVGVETDQGQGLGPAGGFQARRQVLAVGRAEIPVIVAGQPGRAAGLVQEGRDLLGDGQVEVLLQVASAVLAASVDTAVARIDNHGGRGRTRTNDVAHGTQAKEGNEAERHRPFASQDDHHGPHLPRTDLFRGICDVNRINIGAQDIDSLIRVIHPSSVAVLR